MRKVARSFASVLSLSEHKDINNKQKLCCPFVGTKNHPKQKQKQNQKQLYIGTPKQKQKHKPAY